MNVLQGILLRDTESPSTQQKGQCHRRSDLSSRAPHIVLIPPATL